MAEIIAYCGLSCHTCPIYLATREENEVKRDKMRAEIAREIKEHYGIEYGSQDISDCDGCRTEGGRLFSGCKTCRIRRCARDKGLENCACCSEYACEDLEKIFITEPEAGKRLDKIRGNC